MWIQIEDTLINLDHVQKIFESDTHLRFISKNEVLYSFLLNPEMKKMCLIQQIFEALNSGKHNMKIYTKG